MDELMSQKLNHPKSARFTKSQQSTCNEILDIHLLRKENKHYSPFACQERQ